MTSLIQPSHLARLSCPSKFLACLTRETQSSPRPASSASASGISAAAALLLTTPSTAASTRAVGPPVPVPHPPCTTALCDERQPVAGPGDAGRYGTLASAIADQNAHLCVLAKSPSGAGRGGTSDWNTSAPGA